MRRLTVVLVMLGMVLALAPGALAGDPTGASTLEENPGALDFAGSGVVHAVG